MRQFFSDLEINSIHNLNFLIIVQLKSKFKNTALNTPLLEKDNTLHTFIETISQIGILELGRAA